MSRLATRSHEPTTPHPASRRHRVRRRNHSAHGSRHAAPKLQQHLPLARSHPWRTAPGPALHGRAFARIADARGHRQSMRAHPNGDKRYQIYSQSGQLLYESLKPAGSPGVSKTTDYIYLSGTLIAKRAIEDIVVVPVLFKDGFESATTVGAHPGATHTTAHSVDAATRNTPSTLITTITYLHTDPLGSPVAETNTAGTVIRRNRFEPFGYPLNTPTEGMPSYTGHQYDSYTDLIYAQQRYYDSKAGRFPSIDPLTGIGNRYWYGNWIFRSWEASIPDHGKPVLVGRLRWWF